MLETYSNFRFLVGEETIVFSTGDWTILTATVYMISVVIVQAFILCHTNVKVLVLI